MPDQVPSEPLKPGDNFNNRLFSRSSLEEKTGKGPKVKLVLAADYMRYTAKMWNPTPADWAVLRGSQFVLASGSVDKGGEYDGEICVTSVLAVDDAQTPVDMSPYLKPLPASNAADRQRFMDFMRSIEEPSLNRLLKFIFDPEQVIFDEFCEATAAVKMHHAYRGGLLEHTLDVAGLCDAVCKHKPLLDRDFLVTCALLHDLGKLDEMEHGINVGEYTASGALIGHVVSGAYRVRRFADKLPGGFPKRLKDSLMHMMLSHHGTLEFGAAKIPAFAEAHVLAQCDMISAQTFQYAEAKARTQGALTTWLSGRKDGQAFVSDLGTDYRHVASKSEPASVEVFKTTVAVPSPAPLSFTTAKPLPVLGLVAAGSPEQSSDEERETCDVIPPALGADYLLRVTGDSMAGAGINADDLLFVKHQKDAVDGDIVVANIAAHGQVVKRLRCTSGDPGIWLDSENPLVEYASIAFVEGDTIQGKVTGLLREYR